MLHATFGQPMTDDFQLIIFNTKDFLYLVSPNLMRNQNENIEVLLKSLDSRNGASLASRRIEKLFKERKNYINVIR